ncbi:zinc finger CCCH domain-containing protein 17 [Ziziphus jujuba]|uniref:Zinc finger CCCH domain-containing protein 17 n=1 Tax=Ziziphus jujuba TaxID=326968 RepID=A0A6P4B1Z4_ZIZJJ|nr:zinc finger CCCH domain-containing protein 17 [Ziziphus jujuba]
MVAGAQQKPQHQSIHQQQQPPQQVPTTSAEEEALKRNTDCVYFLASPLTCKKGSECEYRHSEYARVNPRDCWYWLNGNCLNPKCAFRHPPLDGLLGTQAATTVGSSVSSAQVVAAPAPAPAPATLVPNNSSKQAVPCIFFQKGLCLKGDRCAFLHGPNPTNTSKVLQAPAATQGSEPMNPKKVFGSLQKCTQDQKIINTNVSKAVGIHPEVSSALKLETALPKNRVSAERNVPATKASDDEALRYKAMSSLPVINGNSIIRPNRTHQIIVSDDHGFQNGKDADEFLRESSPGFDVLVDDELGDPDYFHGEDQYGRTRAHDGRNMNPVDDYDIDRSADYSSVADADRERFRDPRGYDSYEHLQEQYGWDQHRASSERVVVGPAHLDRRGYHKSGSPDNINGSDLRNRLSKQKRGNGLRSVISHDYDRTDHFEEQNYRGSSRRDSHQLHPHEGSLSSRLRGRIKLPRDSSPANGSDFRLEREVDRGRNRSRLSPSRPQVSSPQGRLQDRIKGRLQGDYHNEGRISRGLRIRREDDRSGDFAGPKSLAELKVGKVGESKDQSLLGKRKSVRMEDPQQSEGHLSFEGPKPLSEILKRKREAGVGDSGSGKSSLNKEENNQRQMQSAVSVGTEQEGNKEESKSAIGTEEKTNAAHGQSTQEPNVNEFEAEDGMIYDEEDQELDGEEQRDGDYDYEQGEEGDYNYDGENVEGEEEYIEDEDVDGDGDDFAKKIGVMFS